MDLPVQFGQHRRQNNMSKLTESLRQLGEIQVTDWDFMALLHKDVGELDLSRSLRRLGNVRVMDWDFRKAMNKFAHEEVDLVELLKRTAHYKVMDWDFRSALPDENKTHTPPSEKRLSDVAMQALLLRLENFLRYVVVNLIGQPDHARIMVQQIQANVLRFKLVLVKKDVAMLIGTGGHTASAIRSILKAVAATHDVHVLLEIQSHEEAMDGV